MMKIDCSRQTWAERTNEHTSAFTELLSEPKRAPLSFKYTQLYRIQTYSYGGGHLGASNKGQTHFDSKKDKIVPKMTKILLCGLKMGSEQSKMVTKGLPRATEFCVFIVSTTVNNLGSFRSCCVKERHIVWKCELSPTSYLYLGGDFLQPIRFLYMGSRPIRASPHLDNVQFFGVMHISKLREGVKSSPKWLQYLAPRPPNGPK